MKAGRAARPDIEKLLKDELEGLRAAYGSILAADKEKTAALEAYHQAYSAASQRAELAESQLERRDVAIAKLEAELRDERARPRPEVPF
jgi:hypothetical protein